MSRGHRAEAGGETIDRRGPDVVDVERPWGEFRQFACNERVTVKVITVQPGHRLSLQRHDHRGEFWQVLDRPVEITLDDRQWTALPGETVWVPQGSTHRIGNSGKAAARVLEVAFGHFDEDDIERLDDDYSRRTGVVHSIVEDIEHGLAGKALVR